MKVVGWVEDTAAAALAAKLEEIRSSVGAALDVLIVEQPFNTGFWNSQRDGIGADLDACVALGGIKPFREGSGRRKTKTVRSRI